MSLPAPIQTTPRLVLLDKCQLPLAFSIAPCAQSEIGAWDQEFTKVGGWCLPYAQDGCGRDDIEKQSEDVL